MLLFLQSAPICLAVYCSVSFDNLECWCEIRLAFCSSCFPLISPAAIFADSYICLRVFVCLLVCVFEILEDQVARESWTFVIHAANYFCVSQLLLRLKKKVITMQIFTLTNCMSACSEIFLEIASSRWKSRGTRQTVYNVLFELFVNLFWLFNILKWNSIFQSWLFWWILRNYPFFGEARN